MVSRVAGKKMEVLVNYIIHFTYSFNFFSIPSKKYLPLFLEISTWIDKILPNY